MSSAVPIGSSRSSFIVSTFSPSVWRMNAIWRRIVGFVWALVTISDAVSPFRLVAGASVYWCSVGIHCVAIAAAIPVYVLLRRLARSSAGLSFASAFDRPVTSLLGTSGGRFFRNKPIALVCPWLCCQGWVYWVGLRFPIAARACHASWNSRRRRMGLAPRACCVQALPSTQIYNYGTAGRAA